ncbi:DUF2268 domain-containing putative Zn-dependent protease [Paenibacillus flagellatus]|uniref:DUF2268 domain-containing putative Zn-dependent protease n=1 Tax=Paenibacillus flagellatus TaxID=2211139 RepID=UPI0013051715|nr:DUF2268 domain-containing putative Zn-dependent protease [Paenibacillus flagellatus]
MEWAESEHGTITLLKKVKGRKPSFQDADILSAVRSDGIDILEAQQQYGLFNPSRNLEATKWSFDQSERQQLDTRVLTRLETLARALPSSLLPERLVVVVLPADCANGTLMLNGSGISCYGRAPGYLLLRIWPSTGNLSRLDSVLARSFIHGIRRGVQRIESAIPLGEAFVMEGLAAAFVQSMVPEAAHPELASFLPPADWEEHLSTIARYYGEASYDDVSVNIYGTPIKAGSMRPPKVVPLTEEELEASCTRLAPQAFRQEANVVAAHLYGDPLITAQGLPSFGIPHLGGFEAGYRIVRRFLQKTRSSLSSALSVPWEDMVQAER